MEVELQRVDFFGRNWGISAYLHLKPLADTALLSDPEDDAAGPQWGLITRTDMLGTTITTIEIQTSESAPCLDQGSGLDHDEVERGQEIVADDCTVAVQIERQVCGSRDQSACRESNLSWRFD